MEKEIAKQEFWNDNERAQKILQKNKSLKDITLKITDGSHNPPVKMEKSEYRMLSATNITENGLDYKAGCRYISEKDYIKEKMDIQNMSVKSKTELLSLIDQIPVLPTAFLSHYVCQLYYTLNDTPISVNDIKLQENPMSQRREKKEDFTASEHSPYYYETLLSQSVQDGIPFSDFSNQISSAQVGTMCPGDPLRQKKDEGISLVTIFTRAAIQGGISFEKAYTCSDYYIQSIEAASNITEVIQLIETMYFDITNQVHEATLSAIKNPMICECITYLDTHYREKIDLEELASTLGYTKYYLSTCFKKETGVSISEYITEKRIAYAKLMLKNPSIDMQEISDELCFANPSHFSAVFKKMTGLTPTQYRNGEDCHPY